MKLDRRLNITSLLLGSMALLVTPVHTASLQAGTADRVEVLATVNGDSIMTSDIDRIFAGIHSAMSAEKKNDFDYHALLTKLVNDRLLRQEAEAVGIPEEQSFVDLMHERERSLVSRKFIQLNFNRNDSLNRHEVMDYFRAHYSKVKIRTLSVADRSSADSLMNLIKSGAPMDSLAVQRSVDVRRYQGGLQSIKYWADVEPELKSQLTSTKPGTLFGPFPYRQVYGIMRLEESIPADSTELPQYLGYIENILRTQKAQASWKTFITGLRTRYETLVDSGVINGIVSSTKSVLDSSFQRDSQTPVASLRKSPPTAFSESQLRKVTAHDAMTQATLPIDSLLYLGLDKMIEDAVLYRAGLDAKCDTFTTIKRRLVTTRDSALVEYYLQESIVPRIKFNHEEFQKYYSEHQDEFREADELNLRQVTMASQAKADSAVALLADGADFDYVADNFRDGSKELSEKTDWLALSQFPESISNEMNKLLPGQSSKAYATSDGWIIFKVLGRRDGRLKSLEEVDMKIREVMFQRKFTELLDQTLTELKKSSEIVFFDATIEKYLGVKN